MNSKQGAKQRRSVGVGFILFGVFLLVLGLTGKPDTMEIGLGVFFVSTGLMLFVFAKVSTPAEKAADRIEALEHEVARLKKRP